jgi:hypothetical protein
MSVLPSVPTAGICATSRALASETWRLMEVARSRPHRDADERAFTDHNMIWLEDRHPAEVKVRLFTQSLESRTGADFEWWVGDGSAYLPMLIQAKRLYSDDTYRALSRGRGQLKKLIAACEKGVGSRRDFRGHLPVYAFYNGPPADGLPPDLCCGCVGGPAQRGVTLAAASAVRSALGPRRRSHRASIESIGPFCVPWACIFCCPRVGALDLGTRTYRLISGAGRLDSERWNDDRAQGLAPLRFVDELPEYVQRMLSVDFLREDRRGAMDLGARARPGASMVVVTSLRPDSLAGPS